MLGIEATDRDPHRHRQNRRKRLERLQRSRPIVKKLKKFNDNYKSNKPKAERGFILAFIDGIEDPEWRLCVQEELLKTYPRNVERCHGLRTERIIHIGKLDWEQVYKMMVNMRIPDALK